MALQHPLSVIILRKRVSEEELKYRLAQKLGVKVRRGIVHIIKDRCKGCGACVEFCPSKVLKLSDDFNSRGYHYPVVVEEPPTKVCIACGFCMLICPEFAIYSVPMEDEEE